MANINVSVDYPVTNGTKLKFKTPCDSSEVELLMVRTKNANGAGNIIKVFTFKDAHGNDLSYMGNLFTKDVMVEVMLDVTDGTAYIQNADTNSYIENLKKTVEKMEAKRQELFADVGKIVNEIVDKCTEATKSANKAAQNANNAASGVVTIEQNSQTPLQFWVGTQAEYDALPAKDKTTFYIISDDNTEEQINARFDEIEQAQSKINSNVTDINNRLTETTNKIDEVLNNGPTVEDLTSQITDIQLEGSARLIKSGNLVNFSFTSSNAKEISKSTAYYAFKLCQLPENVAPAQEIRITPFVYAYKDELTGECLPIHARLDINETGVVYVRIYPCGEITLDTIEIYGFGFNITYLLEG